MITLETHNPASLQLVKNTRSPSITVAAIITGYHKVRRLHTWEL